MAFVEPLDLVIARVEYKMRPLLESKIQAKFILLCKAHGFDALKHTCPGRAGEPDVEVRFTDAAGTGHAAYVELKKPGEVPEKIQEHRIRTLRAAGFICGWADDADEAFRVLLVAIKEKGIVL
jgi:hypothetical protein